MDEARRSREAHPPAKGAGRVGHPFFLISSFREFFWTCGVPLQFGQEVGNFGGAPVYGADEFAADDSLAIDDESLRDQDRPIEALGFGGRVTDADQVAIEALQEAVVRALVDVFTNR